MKVSECFNSEGYCWAVMGKTYDIREELRNEGAKYSPVMGWFFLKPSKRQCVKFSIREVSNGTDWNETAGQYVCEQMAIAATEGQEFLGEVGNRLEICCRLVDSTFVNSYYGVGRVYTFETVEGDEVVWITQANVRIEKDKLLRVRGTVKEHRDYNFHKQTILTRCKLEEV